MKGRESRISNEFLSPKDVRARALNLGKNTHCNNPILSLKQLSPTWKQQDTEGEELHNHICFEAGPRIRDCFRSALCYKVTCITDNT